VRRRPIYLILDTSAIRAFARASIDVGEIISEVNDESAAVGLPVLCLVEANRTAADQERLEILLRHEAATVLDVRASNWRELAAMSAGIDSLAAASAALATVDLRCFILTSEPQLYTRSGLTERIIALPVPDQ
jgi:hypothetical protein